MEVESQPVKPSQSQMVIVPTDPEQENTTEGLDKDATSSFNEKPNNSSNIEISGTSSSLDEKSITSVAAVSATIRDNKPIGETVAAALNKNADCIYDIDNVDIGSNIISLSKRISTNKEDPSNSSRNSDSKPSKKVTAPANAGVDTDGDVTMKSTELQSNDTPASNKSHTAQSITPPLAATAIAVAMSAAASVVVAAAGISTAIPENILSPPKSETQTDDTNTATSPSSGGSDSQLSPLATVTTANIIGSATTNLSSPTLEASATSSGAPGSPKNTGDSSSPTSVPQSTIKEKSHQYLGSDSGGGNTRVVQPINVIANGTIPKSSGKPQMAAMNKKLNKSTRAPRQRKTKATVPMYESEISDNKTGIKLCIKKSDSSGNLAATASALTSVSGVANTKISPATATVTAKQTRKRSRKSKSKAKLDSDDSEYETKRRKERPSNQTDRLKKISLSHVASEEQTKTSIEQGDWGARLPQELLYKIFETLVDSEGALPILCRLGRVCSLWRNVSLTPSLWKSLDLTTCIKDKYRTELKLKWLIDNRCSECTKLNLANWKVSDINCFLAKLAKGCPNLTSITLSGWKGFTSDHLAYLTENMPKLERLDLSSVNVEMNASKSAVGVQSLCNALQTMNKRLTHLYLAHNRLAGLPQIVATLSTHCPNLAILDLSNVTTQASSHGVLHVEKLQHGCKKLKVLRVTNSHVTLSAANLQETMDSPGFPELEELSVAALTDEARVTGDEHLQRILKSSSKLKLLDVRGCARLTHESLIRLPTWDIKHLFLSGCSVTRDVGSGLELIASKWARSLIELDLAWANVQQPLDDALRAIAEKGSESPLAHLNLCGSSVSEEAVKEILANCAHMKSINLSSCRGLPRGVKRLMQGPQELQELRDVLGVNMKVKLPSQMKEEEERRQQAAKLQNCGESEDGGAAGGSGSRQSN